MTLNNQTINFDKLETIATEAVTKLETSNRADAKRWINAIRKGVNELQENPFWNYDASNYDFVIMSATSNTIYSVNKFCYCQAASKNKPCRHSAMHRLLLRYAEQA